MPSKANLFYCQNESSFPCEQWFSKSKGDKKIKRTLYPKGMTMEQVEAAEKGMRYVKDAEICYR